MTLQEIISQNGTKRLEIDFAEALITQKGGWTLAEIRPQCVDPTEFSRADLDDAMVSLREHQTAITDAQMLPFQIVEMLNGFED